MCAFFTEVAHILKIGKGKRSLQEMFKTVLGIEEVDESKSFKDLGGDSLSFVAMSIELEDIFDELPEKWEEMTIKELLLLSEAKQETGL